MRLPSAGVATASRSVSAPATACFPRATLCPRRAYGTNSNDGGGDGNWAEKEDDEEGEADEGSPHRRHTSLSKAVEEGEGERRRTASPSLRSAYPPSGIELPESSFLKCIEKEIDDEKLRLDKEEGPPPIPLGWELHHEEGSSVFYARRMWIPPASRSTPAEPPKTTDREAVGDCFPSRRERCVEKHYIRVQLTTRDASLDPECDIRGEHFPFSFFVQRIRLRNDGEGDAPAGSRTSLDTVQVPTFDDAEELSMYENSIEVRLDVVDGELVVDNVVYHGVREILSESNRQKLRPTTTQTNGPSARRRTAADGEEEEEGGEESASPLCNRKTHRDTREMVFYNNVFGGYPGPNLNEMEEDVLDGIQSWLAERQIDDRFGEFVGQYSVWVEQAEYERWLQQLYDYVAA